MNRRGETLGLTGGWLSGAVSCEPEQAGLASFLARCFQLAGGKIAWDFQGLATVNRRGILDLVAVGLVEEGPQPGITVDPGQGGDSGECVAVADAIFAQNPLGFEAGLFLGFAAGFLFGFAVGFFFGFTGFFFGFTGVFFGFTGLFLGGQAPGCSDATDANDDGIIDLSDPVVTLVSLIAVTAYCSRCFRDVYYRQVREELTRLADLAAGAVSRTRGPGIV